METELIMGGETEKEMPSPLHPSPVPQPGPRERSGPPPDGCLVAAPETLEL